MIRPRTDEEPWTRDRATRRLRCLARPRGRLPPSCSSAGCHACAARASNREVAATAEHAIGTGGARDMPVTAAVQEHSGTAGTREVRSWSKSMNASAISMTAQPATQRRVDRATRRGCRRIQHPVSPIATSQLLLLRHSVSCHGAAPGRDAQHTSGHHARAVALGSYQRITLEGSLCRQRARMKSASPDRKLTMLRAARRPWRSTDSLVRLPMWGVTMMLSMPQNG